MLLIRIVWLKLIESTNMSAQQREDSVGGEAASMADGEECMAYLRREPPFEDAPTPDLILLDLNMPRMGGREVLAELVADEELRGLPVVILSTAAEHDEVMGLTAHTEPEQKQVLD